ncbi:RING-H2 finger protein ATL2-like [Phoenix dactylifera]|uniref:RING-type E3 ubiquitin transferase n=1 Tax=Phoenix dactylifera TaxID=42345 RepID=A0A8B7CVQ4_PHODC|nr:RING-H2 finger protein ATL2-like [Phoenix dactylifera]
MGNEWKAAFFALLVFTTIAFILFIYYIRHLRRGPQQLPVKAQASAPIAATTSAGNSLPATPTVSHAGPAASGGLDPSVLRWLPVFIYSSMAYTECLECTLCLKGFVGGEEGRLLPRCYHSFHKKCVDRWFHSHSTCPLCRSKVEAEVSE